MDTEAFVSWCFDSARTVDDRYTVELLVELGLGRWNSRRKIYDHLSLDESIARSRERKLNPAYEPHYSEEDLRKAIEFLSEIKDWWLHSDRPIRSFAPLRFLTTLESLSCSFGEPEDIEPLAHLPALHTLSLGYPGADRYNMTCADYRPLARCIALRNLTLGFGYLWPDFTGFETLTQLEKLELSGNLLALPHGIAFPKVVHGALHCLPLAARNVADLPQLPACEFLTLFGAERLDGIDAMPHLRNLTLLGTFHSFAPLVSLRELTCLTVTPKSHADIKTQPRDISPLAHLPNLHYLKIGPSFFHDMPRDYSPLVEAPALRELHVENCPPVQMEVAAIQAGLPPWDDVFLAPEPRPLPPLRMIVAPSGMSPHVAQSSDPGDSRAIDLGLRACEGRWAAQFAREFISTQLDNSDWGTLSGDGVSRWLHATVESFDVVERLPEIVAAFRGAIARLRYGYIGQIMVALKVKPPEPSPAQKELDEQLQEERDKWEFEQHQRDEREYLDRLHQLELKKQQGAEIDPDEFSPSEEAPYPTSSSEEEELEDDDALDAGSEDEGEIIVKEKPDPEPMLLDEDEHPLADHYRLLATLTLDEIWFMPHHRGIAVHLMQREPDLEYPDKEAEAS